MPPRSQGFVEKAKLENAAAMYPYFCRVYENGGKGVPWHKSYPLWQGLPVLPPAHHSRLLLNRRLGSFFLYNSQSWTILQYWSHKQGCGSAFISSGSRSSILSWIPIWIQYGSGIRIQGFNDQKLKKITAEKKIFGSKTTIYLSPGLHKERPRYRSSLQLSKEAIQHFKTWTFNIFFYFLGSFLPSWIRIPNPDPLTPIESGSSPDPDPQPWPQDRDFCSRPLLIRRSENYLLLRNQSWPMLCKWLPISVAD